MYEYAIIVNVTFEPSLCNLLTATQSGERSKHLPEGHPFLVELIACCTEISLVVNLSSDAFVVAVDHGCCQD